MVPRDTRDFKCEYCGQGKFAEHSLQRHIESNHLRKCSLLALNGLPAKKYFIKKGNKIHLNWLFYLGTRVYTHETKCPHCEAIFEKANLKRHIKTVHEGIKDYKCNHCGKEYFEKKRLNRHIKREHDNIRDEKCNQCGKLYFSKEGLNLHIRNIHKHFSCHLCDEAFPTNFNLVEHLNMKHPKKVRYDAAIYRIVKKRIRAGKRFFY